MEPRGKKLITRYKKTYNIPAEVDITEEMILTHWNLEKRLTAELLESNPEDRWATFDRCYTNLYTELEWLNQFSGMAECASPRERFAGWLELIGPPPKRIYEIGSGKGDLIAFLADHGYDCRATEITRARGEKLLSPRSHTGTKPSWGVSDGVYLDKFEPPGTYDVLISDQLIEHIHPEDLESHLRGAYSILKSGGRYIFNTPSKYTGPHDVSRVFKRPAPECMHLKEYACREMVEMTRRAGFRYVRYGFVPRRFQWILMAFGARDFARSDQAGMVFLQVVLFSEKFLSTLHPHALRSLCAKLFCTLGIFSGTVSLVAEK